MKLTYQDKNKYFINRKKKFNPSLVPENFVEKSLDFSLAMVLGSGYHRAHRSGGQMYRNPIEQIANTFQGKLAEFMVYEQLRKNGFLLDLPDLSVLGKGVWDTIDLTCMNHKINIKSCAYFSNLLLLETSDWNEDAAYIPNLQEKKSANYDFFVLVRIKPDIKTLLYKANIQFQPSNQAALQKLLVAQNYFFDFGGVCTHATLCYIIKQKYILPQNALLNGKIKMDASNYYIQADNLKDFSFLVNRLKKA
ncbi:MAG: hypothetical protein LAT51_07930 [Flavobacteriaceae bacterium]|nr:hypothetical protein [Flavobacteriaceae bacterium]